MSWWFLREDACKLGDFVTRSRHRGMMSEVLADLRHIYVLLVEDDAEMQDFTASLLRMCGATVTAASEARQALTVIRQVIPHAVITDVVLPDKDGCCDQSSASRAS
jgi:PleD family two-component response regulator